ncbi:MAG: hypothetical protein KME47_23710 [Nodosilinea sp. WJT8-NPBG4]|jgi:D-beta-D-heptose 7-phosphate kinase/D-beta-D-heptose 1-phosphate adenosyltransferase|nr:hypothetical protein [Nodosilinea sp. WJT8-NPBG4]
MPTPDTQTQCFLSWIDRFPHLRVLVIGDAILDSYLQGAANRLCREGPVPIVDVAEAEYVPGGAANAAANVASLGGTTHFLTVIGDDAPGGQLCTELERAGVQLEGVVRSRDRQTLVKQRLLADNQLLVRFDQGSTAAISQIEEDRLIEQLNQQFPLCDAVVISDYAYGVLTPRVILHLQRLQERYARLLVADSKRLKTYAPLGVTAVKPNYDEAIALLNLPRLSGAQRVEQMTRHGQGVLAATGARMAAITLDRDGALIFLQDDTGTVADPARTFADPAPSANATGAGDTYLPLWRWPWLPGLTPTGRHRWRLRPRGSLSPSRGRRAATLSPCGAPWRRAISALLTRPS